MISPEIMRLAFRVDTLPIAQPRPRVFKPHRYSRPRAVSAPIGHPIHQFKADIKSAAEDVYQDDPIDCPIVLSCDFFFPRASSRRWKRKPMPREFHVKRPDFDNLIKAVADALTGIIYTDDNRIVDCRITKWTVAGTYLDGVYSEERPGCEITIIGVEQ